jgi:hypothetical protein
MAKRGRPPKPYKVARKPGRPKGTTKEVLEKRRLEKEARELPKTAYVPSTINDKYGRASPVLRPNEPFKAHDLEAFDHETERRMQQYREKGDEQQEYITKFMRERERKGLETENRLGVNLSPTEFIDVMLEKSVRNGPTEPDFKPFDLSIDGILGRTGFTLQLEKAEQHFRLGFLGRELKLIYIGHKILRDLEHTVAILQEQNRIGRYFRSIYTDSERRAFDDKWKKDTRRLQRNKRLYNRPMPEWYLAWKAERGDATEPWPLVNAKGEPVFLPKVQDSEANFYKLGQAYDKMMANIIALPEKTQRSLKRRAETLNVLAEIERENSKAARKWKSDQRV